MATFRPLTGKKFGALTVIHRAPNRGKHIYYLCKCDCGKEKEIRNDALLNGHAVNCGCKRKPRSDMRYNYKNYGGRGISVCDEWLGADGFEHFRNWALENGYSESGERSKTIDRIDVNEMEIMNQKIADLSRFRSNSITQREIFTLNVMEKHIR